MTPVLTILSFISNLGVPEMIVIGLVALLIFGRRLPEVGRSLGKGIVEFKKGLRDTGDEMQQIGSDAARDIPSKPLSNNGAAPTDRPHQS